MDLTEKKQRALKKTTFAWQSKNPLRLIRKKTTRKKRPYRIAVYNTLSEVASNAGRDRFETWVAKISDMSGVSYETLEEIWKDFVSWNLIIKEQSRNNGKFGKLRITLLEPNLPIGSLDEEYTVAVVSEEDAKKLAEGKLESREVNKEDNIEEILEYIFSVLDEKNFSSISPLSEISKKDSESINPDISAGDKIKVFVNATRSEGASAYRNKLLPSILDDGVTEWVAVADIQVEALVNWIISDWFSEINPSFQSLATHQEQRDAVREMITNEKIGIDGMLFRIIDMAEIKLLLREGYKFDYQTMPKADTPVSIRNSYSRIIEEAHRIRASEPYAEWYEKIYGGENKC